MKKWHFLKISHLAEKHPLYLIEFALFTKLILPIWQYSSSYTLIRLTVTVAGARGRLAILRYLVCMSVISQFCTPSWRCILGLHGAAYVLLKGFWSYHGCLFSSNNDHPPRLENIRRANLFRRSIGKNLDHNLLRIVIRYRLLAGDVWHGWCWSADI